MKPILLTLVTVAWATVSAATAQTIYTGHWDISAHGHLHDGDMELEVGLHNHDLNTEIELPNSGVQFQIGFGNASGTGPADKQDVTIGSGTNSIILSNVWVTAPTGPIADSVNQPFIGFSAEELLVADGWNGPVTFTLTGLLYAGSGTGNLFLFEDETIFWNSTLSGANKGSFTVGAGQHDHGEFAFSEEGLYTLTLEVSGKYNNNIITSSPTTLNINVVPEPSSGALLLAGLAALAVTRRKIRRLV
jgi:surface-anchored protein